ncbi:MAG: Gfo/Idh/MocA family oxidoreductase [Clostridia bacterium]|nr:Gfo/Idh/MocA family oxidoreductase [Clostridia bacterium]
MRKIKIAVVGLGHPHSMDTTEALLRLTDDFEVVGIAEPSPDYCHPEHVNSPRRPKLYGTLARYTVDELLAMDDLDAVAIECEEENGTKYAQMFAEKGIHIHFDKPGTHGVASFERLVETCRANGSVLHMGYMYRYNALVQRAMEMKKAGEFGDIYSVEAHMSLLYAANMASWIGKHKGGMMYYLGCHDVDLVMQFMGGAPEEVIPLNASTGQYGLDSENYGFAVLNYPSGASFVKTTCAEPLGYGRRQLVINGSKATMEIKPIEIGLGYREESGVMLKARAVINRANGATETVECEPFERYEGMLRGFASYVRGERENPYTYDYELSLFRTVMKACGC